MKKFGDIFKKKEASITEEPIFFETNPEAKDGQEKCPKCGATDISLNINTKMLRCNFCRHEFEAEKATGIEKDVSKIKGINIGAGAKNIESDVDNVITLKCQSCGAEVVIDTEEATQSRCHWCRNTLSINQKIPNGTIPDVVLPFSVKKEDAQAEIEKFVKERSFFVNSNFKKEFTAENILGVYLPYMIVDVNAHVALTGKGEHLTKEYTEGSGDDKDTYYDADLYNVEREFDIHIDDLTVESSEEKLNKKKRSVTNNIINSIMPFDTQNALKWNANYLKGFTSEKRNVNVDNLTPLIEKQAKDVARHKANSTLNHYDRGVKWDKESIEIHGQQWVAAYLPVWIYSYHEKKVGGNRLHYTAVNARTKETMGSVPLNVGKLIFFSILVVLAGFILGAVAGLIVQDPLWVGLAVGGACGPIFFWQQYKRYRNTGERHYHELETKSKMKNLRKVDEFVKHQKRLSDEYIKGRNNTSVKGK